VQSGLPHELRPGTLDTLGTSQVNGLLETPVLAAHYRVVREEDGSRTWVAFSSNSGLGGTELIFYEIAGGRHCWCVSWVCQSVSLVLLVMPSYH
jgi:all-trans-8'-apo-beta-carotenal 15,15'-oxygenase